MTQYLTNNDKILQAVLSDAQLSELGNYNPSDYQTLDEAFDSDNAVVKTVAELIGGLAQNFAEKQIYNQIFDRLRGEVL